MRHAPHLLRSAYLALLSPLWLTLACGGFTSEIDSDEWTDSQEEAAKSRSVKLYQNGPAELRARPSERISITYNWSGGPTSKSLINFIHFVNAEGAIIFQDDHWPSVPTNQWSKNPWSEVREYVVPQDAPVGTLRVFAGLHDGGPGGSGARLKLKKGFGVSEDSTSPRRYLVGTVVIEAPVVANLPGTPSFTRAYRGATSGNRWSPSWSWQASAGGLVQTYRVSSDFQASFVTTDTSWSPFLQTLPEGAHWVSVVAVNSAGESAPVTDTLVIAGTNPNNNQPNHGIYGVTGASPDIPAGSEIKDAIGVRYKFRVDANTSPYLKLIFGYQRTYGSGPDTYILEANQYDARLAYADGICTGWPMAGQNIQTEASLRFGIPDYPLKGKVGTKTFSPAVFPRQGYLIDGITDLWKTDLISQTNLNGKEGLIEISRGALVADKSGWKCSGNLDASTYRQWDIAVTIDGVRHAMAAALPEDSARYLAPWELVGFRSEFFNGPGVTRLFYWDFELQRENGATVRLDRWKVNEHDGYLVDFGVRKASYAGRSVLEISSDGPTSYLAKGQTFDLSF